MKDKSIIEVILPISVEGTFSYTSNQQIEIGKRVLVQFGKRKLYTGIVFSNENKYDSSIKYKNVLEILDEIPVVGTNHLNFWKWISEYYMCSIGAVMKAAIPNFLKLESDTIVKISKNYDGDTTDLKEEEIDLISHVYENSKLKLDQIFKDDNFHKSAKKIYSLVKRDILFFEESVKEKFSDKVEKKVKILDLKNKENLISKRAKKQIKLFEVLQSFFDSNKKEIKIKDLPNHLRSNSLLKSLESKSIIEIYYDKISRFDFSNISVSPIPNLSNEQRQAYDLVNEKLLTKDICLLHGITGSGKTEIYCRIIDDYIKKGKKVLYVLPEIALTTQIIKRLKTFFGNMVGIYHSKMSNNERVEIWNQFKSDSASLFKIIVGARSSIFLPFDNLDLIIIDEEHDSSLKQTQPSPRYHARDCAIILSKIHNSKIILGSATPSLETIDNIKQKKYEVVRLDKRYGNIELPSIEIIDLRKSHLKKEMNGFFSNRLIDEIKLQLDNKKQIIIFHNRRGFSPFVICEFCGTVPKCKSCDVSLTYHIKSNCLKCHYCGNRYDFSKKCSSCSQETIEKKGFATQKIEDNLSEIFPQIRISRMDYDSTRNKNSYENIINDFEEKKIDVLVGTQMVTKGLDFDNVGLVSIIDADSLLNFPSFNSNEKAYQQLIQVSGRSGRKERGKVLIQAFDTENKLLADLKMNNFSSMVERELNQRKDFNYPPYTRIIGIKLKSKNVNELNVSSSYLSKALKDTFGHRVLGPMQPQISKIRDYNIIGFMIKIERNASVSKAKNILKEIIQRFENKKINRKTNLEVDIDPISL